MGQTRECQLFHVSLVRHKAGFRAEAV
jgi:hypothetical protein